MSLTMREKTGLSALILINAARKANCQPLSINDLEGRENITGWPDHESAHLLSDVEQASITFIGPDDVKVTFYTVLGNQPWEFVYDHTDNELASRIAMAWEVACRKAFDPKYKEDD
jgi:hypothetical protein